MKLFRKSEKPQKTIIDEEKLAKIAEYKASGYGIIKNLQVKPLSKFGTYITGKVYFRLMDEYISVDIYEDNVPLDYVEKCAIAINEMPDELIDTICRAARIYYAEFMDAVDTSWREEIEKSAPVAENTPLRDILKYFSLNELVVGPPQDPSKIGYQLSGNCDWEIEHGIEIDILDGKLVYLGAFSGESPWDDHSNENWNFAAHIYDKN